MQKSYLKAADLIGYGVRTTDEGEAGLRDLVIDAALWTVPYVLVDAEAWAPGHDVLVALRSLAAVDEAARAMDVELTLEEVRDSPTLATDAPVARDYEENWYRHEGWEEQWSVEASTVDASEPVEPASPPVEEPLPGEVNAQGPGLVRFEELRLWQGETSDGEAVKPVDLLVDDSDWSVAYVEVELDAGEATESCLVERTLIGVLDRETERLYLDAAASALRDAPLRSYPGAGEEREVRILEGVTP